MNIDPLKIVRKSQFLNISTANDEEIKTNTIKDLNLSVNATGFKSCVNLRDVYLFFFKGKFIISDLDRKES